MTNDRTTSGSSIDYDALAQEAMRGVVRTILQRTAKSGLPGDHHFYISFDTQAPGANISKRLKEKYPEEMTIVLQHRFWDLIVTDERFEVKLTFDGIPERLTVPFAAVKVFCDPSVRFMLQFEEAAASGDPDTPAARNEAGERVRPYAVPSAPISTLPARPATPRPVGDRKPRPQRARSKSDAKGEAGAGEAGEAAPARPQSAPVPAAAKPAARPELAAVEAGPAAKDGGPKEEAPAAGPAGSGAQVVRLDQFRKK